MTRCQQCGNHNLNGAEFCDECGARLSNVSEHSFVPPPPPAFLREDLRPIPVRPLSPIGRLFEESGEVQVSGGRITLIMAGLAGKEFLLTNPETLIGRWDSTRGNFPEIDLERADLETKVSRRHARIFRQDNQFWIEDLGSLNGTVVKRQQKLQHLQSGQPFLLRDGDEIIVGKIFLKFAIA